MLAKIQQWMDQYDMLAAGDSVMAAISGGADSVCLLSVLQKLAPARGWQVRALHMHHGIRGEEADRDEDFVRKLCKDLGIPLTVIHENVPLYAKEQRLSEEEAGRILRYEALEKTAVQWEEESKKPAGTVKIAVAHHQDDNAETILHHLLRGSGFRGLSGIPPVKGRRIRPLLCVRRDEIRDYLRENGYAWCEDSTNTDSGYTRNRIRQELIPLMTEKVNRRAVENILHTGELIAQADEYLEQEAGWIFGMSGRVEDGRAAVALDVFCGQKPIMRSYILRLMLDQAAPGQKDLTGKHYEALDRLAYGRPGGHLDLPGRLMAGRDYRELGMGPVAENGHIDLPGEIAGVGELSVVWDPSEENGEAGGLVFTTFSRQNEWEIPKNQYTKWFDYDKIKGMLSVRTRRSGDYITLAGGGRKSVSRYMIDEKIPRDERDQIRLLAEGSHILWVIGFRISEYYKVTEETTRILQAGKTEDRTNVG